MDTLIKPMEKKQSYWIFLLYAVLCFLIHTLPMVKYSVPYIIAFPFTLAFAAFIFLRFTEYRDTVIYTVVFSALTAVLLFLVSDPINPTEAVNEVIRVLRYFVPALLFVYSVKCGKKASLILWAVITAVLVFVMITTTKALAEDEMIARTLAQGSADEELTEYRMQNVGGFGFAYAMGMTVPVLTYLVLVNKAFWKRLTALVALIGVLAFIISTQYTTLLLLSVISIAVVVFFMLKSPLARLTVFVLAVLLCISMGSVFEWLSDHLSGAMLKEKFRYLADAYNGTSRLGDSTSRVSLYQSALKQFISSPIFGKSGDTNAHSTVLNFAGRTGLIGLAGYGGGLWIYYKTIADSLKNAGKSVAIFAITFIAFVVLSIFNPTHYVYEIAYTLLLYVPLTIYLFAPDKNRKTADVSEN